MLDLNNSTKEELLHLIAAYDEYIYNGGEEWGADRQPVGIGEFFDNEYQDAEY